MQIKVCQSCLSSKSRAEFSIGTRERDGLQRECRMCNAAYRVANRESIAARKAEYYKANCARIAEKDAAYRSRNKEKIAARQRAHYEKNKVRLLARQTAYREANADACRASIRAWQKRNPSKLTAYNASRRALQGRATPGWANALAIAAIYDECRRLTDLTGVKHNVDHIYPLNNDFVQGLHVEHNLQIITALENAVKSNRLLSSDTVRASL